MKAKDYFLKYDEPVMEEARRPETQTDGPMAKMFIEFFKEVGEIAEQRHAKFDRSITPIVEEQNKNGMQLQIYSSRNMVLRLSKRMGLRLHSMTV